MTTVIETATPTIQRDLFNIGVVAFLFDETYERVLLGKRKDDDPYFLGDWALIGGGLEASDVSLEEAMSREVVQETDLNISPSAWCLSEARMWTAQSRRPWISVYFETSLPDSVIAKTRNLEPDHHDMLKWMLLVDLEDIPIRDPERRLIRLVAERPR